jgi:hypothetical protein
MEGWVEEEGLEWMMAMEWVGWMRELDWGSEAKSRSAWPGRLGRYQLRFSSGERVFKWEGISGRDRDAELL